MGMCFLYGNGGVSLNFAVKKYASQDALLADTPKENTIGIVSDTQIKSYAFSATQPGLTYEDADLMADVTLDNGYFGSNGTVSGASTANPELYTETYIPVSYGVNYEWEYTVSAKNSMWLAICEYTGDGHTFKSPRIVAVNSVSGTSQKGVYTPSAATVTAVRLSWRTFPSATYTMSFVQPDVPHEADIDDGTVWIETRPGSTVSFNALKKDVLQVYPVAVHQRVNASWVDVDASIYQNGAWLGLWNGELFENGNQYTGITGGWPAAAGTLSESDPYLLYSAGTGKLIISSGKKIDITNYSQLHVIGVARGDYSASGGVSSRDTDFGIATAVTASSVTFEAKLQLTKGYNSTITESYNTEQVLDISSLSGEYYIAAAVSTTTSHTNANIGIKKMWLT